jgi:hypothetical protein
MKSVSYLLRVRLGDADGVGDLAGDLVRDRDVLRREDFRGDERASSPLLSRSWSSVSSIKVTCTEMPFEFVVHTS